MATGTQPPDGDGQDHVLTDRQQKILDFIREYVEHRRYSPSMREIADAADLRSTSTVSYHLKILEEKGYLTRGTKMPRTVAEKPPRLRVQEKSEDPGKALVGIGSRSMVGVPLFERIAAGSPVIVNPNSEGFMQLPSELVGSGVLFAVRVVGDSMVNASIFDGDYVVVRQQDAADNGDIVAALIEEEATVKTFHRVNGHVWLMPQNPSYQPIEGDQCRLMGKVVATVHPI